jgi:ribosomal protein L37AE/L43A
MSESLEDRLLECNYKFKRLRSMFAGFALRVAPNDLGTDSILAVLDDAVKYSRPEGQPSEKEKTEILLEAEAILDDEDAIMQGMKNEGCFELEDKTPVCPKCGTSDHVQKDSEGWWVCHNTHILIADALGEAAASICMLKAEIKAAAKTLQEEFGMDEKDRPLMDIVKDVIDVAESNSDGG